jgi:hypothetical protein
MHDDQLPPLEVTLRGVVALRDALNATNTPHVFIGAMAVAACGHIRTTFDVDALAVLEPTQFGAFLETAAKHGITARIQDAEKFAAKHRVLLLVHRPTNVTMELSLALLPFEHRMIGRARVVEMGQIQFRLPLTEDLIVMKATAHRLKDLDDIQNLIDADPDLDRNYIINELRPFAEALDSPDLVDEIRRLLG